MKIITCLIFRSKQDNYVYYLTKQNHKTLTNCERKILTKLYMFINTTLTLTLTLILTPTPIYMIGVCLLFLPCFSRRTLCSG